MKWLHEEASGKVVDWYPDLATHIAEELDEDLVRDKASFCRCKDAGERSANEGGPVPDEDLIEGVKERCGGFWVHGRGSDQCSPTCHESLKHGHLRRALFVAPKQPTAHYNSNYPREEGNEQAAD